MNLKERIIHGWNISAKGYSTKIVQSDFVLPGKAVWTDLILSAAPYPGALRILDIGTGPGVFATILNLAGHETTGIDISPDMLAEARENARKYGAECEFLLMDSEEPDFADDTFDMVVSRNVVWIMQDPEKAYQSWLRILKPGGRLVVFDTGHDESDFLTTFDHNNEKYIADYKAEFGTEPPISFPLGQYEEARGWKRELPLTHRKRPEWDVGIMEKLGYTDIFWEDVAEKAAYTKEQEYEYRNRVFFRLCGSKPG